MDATTTLTITGTTDVQCQNTSTPGNSTLPPCQSETDDTSALQNIFSIIVTVVLAILMVGIGCAIEIRKVARHFKKPTGIVTGLICQFVIMPVLAYCWAKIFALDSPETLALLIIGSCPGGTLSNIIAYWIGGDMELSATMTSVSVTASLGMLPLLLFIYSRLLDENDISVPFSTIGTTLALIVGPLAVGAITRWKFPKVAVKLLKICGIVGMVALLVVTAITIYLFHPYWSFQVSTIVIAICYPLCGMVLGYALTSLVSVIAKPLRLTHRERRTVSIETGIQNQQVAMAIIQLSGWSLSVTGRVISLPMMYSFAQLAWSIVYIGLFHFVSYARNGECPQLKSRDDDEGEKNQPIGKFSTIADNRAFEEEE